jgi:hypothetical protein
MVMESQRPPTPDAVFPGFLCCPAVREGITHLHLGREKPLETSLLSQKASNTILKLERQNHN